MRKLSSIFGLILSLVVTLPVGASSVAEFTQQPTRVNQSEVMNVVVASSDALVTLELLDSNGAGGVLHGTLTQPTYNGEATFDDIYISEGLGQYVLVANGTPSDEFTVSDR